MKYFIYTFFATLFFCENAQAQDLYALDRIQELRLYFENDDWEKVLDSLKQQGHKERVVADAKLNGKPLSKVGMRFKGNSSYNSARNVFKRKLPMNIKADFVDKSQRLDGAHATLKLANGFRDPSMVREALAYEIAAQYMPVPSANFMNVYVNDRHYGLYTNVESIDDAFMEKHFGTPDSTLIKCDVEDRVQQARNCPKASDRGTLQYIGTDTLCYMNIYEASNDSKGLRQLQTLTRILNEQPDKIERHLNVDRALWMLAFNNVLVNLDSYSGIFVHNYYLAQDKSSRFNPLLWDMNLCFGGFTILDSEHNLSLKEMQELSLFIHFKDKGRPMIHQLLANPRYRKTYLAHVRTILDENFTNGKYLERARAIQRSIDAAVKADESKFYSYQSFLQNLTQSAKAGDVDIVGIQELMEGRTAYLSQHPLLKEKGPDIQRPTATASAGQARVSAQVQGADKVWLAYRADGFSAFQYLEMTQNGAGSAYGASVEKDKIVQYYIYAENDKTASLSPARAEYEFYELK
jgi:spore coat protein CotH